MDTIPHCDITKVWADILCCPRCHSSLVSVKNSDMNKQVVQCSNCKAEFFGIAGAFDLSDIREDEKPEHDHYQQDYLSRLALSAENFNPSYWSKRWIDTHWPEGRLLLERLRDLNGKVVLCLGNGASVRELHFLALGARLICSDLSMSGILAAKSRYKLGELGKNVAFHAMDACRIPVKGHSIDIVYGYEFVHHLPDLDVFFNEIHRVLKPGGLCVFFDSAYSPIWQVAKKTFLWPLMKFSHLLYRRSPEDIRATYAGGFKRSYLEELALIHGLRNGFFDRVMFFQYLATRGIGSIFGWKLPQVCYRIPGTIGRFIDRLLVDRIRFLERNRIGLVWGFQSE